MYSGGMVIKSVEQYYEEARKLIGTEIKPVHGRYPVEYDAIRRYCHMIDDTNPLFLDSEYAQNTNYGDVICPPFFMRYFAAPGAWPPSEPMAGLPTPVAGMPTVPAPGDAYINLAVEWEFFKTVRIGDRLSTRVRIADVYIKPIRLDPKAFWVVTETTFTNQNNEVVAVLTNLMMIHRSPGQFTETVQ